jgi:hypothetical protein
MQFFEGTAESAFGRLGGGNQVFIPKPVEPKWIVDAGRFVPP